MPRRSPRLTPVECSSAAHLRRSTPASNKLMARRRFNDALPPGLKVSVNDLLIKALAGRVACPMQRHFRRNELIRYSRADILAG